MLLARKNLHLDLLSSTTGSVAFTTLLNIVKIEVFADHLLLILLIFSLTVHVLMKTMEKDGVLELPLVKESVFILDNELDALVNIVYEGELDSLGALKVDQHE
jgi:hypothetical protein